MNFEFCVWIKDVIAFKWYNNHNRYYTHVEITVESLKNWKIWESKKWDKFLITVQIFTVTRQWGHQETKWDVIDVPVEPPFKGDGAAKMFDLMWFLIERGVIAESLFEKMSLLPPPKVDLETLKPSDVIDSRGSTLPGGFNTLKRQGKENEGNFIWEVKETEEASK